MTCDGITGCEGVKPTLLQTELLHSKTHFLKPRAVPALHGLGYMKTDDGAQ